MEPKAMSSKPSEEEIEHLLTIARIEGATQVTIWERGPNGEILEETIAVVPDYDNIPKAPEGMVWHPVLEKFVPEELLDATIEVPKSTLPEYGEDDGDDSGGEEENEEQEQA